MVVVLTVAGLIPWSAARGVQGLKEARAVAATLQSLEAQFGGLQADVLRDTTALQGTVDQIDSKLDRASNSLTPWLTLSSFLGWVPKVGGELRNAQAILDLGRDLAGGSGDLLAGVNAAPERATRQGSSLIRGDRFNEAVLQDLTAAEPLFDLASDQFAPVTATAERLESRDLPVEYRRVVMAAQRIAPKLEALARTGQDAARSWRSFMGFDGPRTYLIVAQNSDELRATGGFIPGAWVLTLDRGEILELQFWDTVAIDDLSAGPPVPPQDLLQSLWAGAWLFRDAGWLPDFPVSAGIMQQMFQLGQGISLDGVISVDQGGVKDILAAVGPIVLETGATVNTDTYMEVLEAGTDEQGHLFMDTVLQSLLDGVRAPGSGNKLSELLSALNRGLREKHVLLFFHDPDLQAMASRNGWTGALQSAPGDFLMVVDSNVGFNKVNRNIEQLIDYQVSLGADGEATARLDLLYTNQSQGVAGEPCPPQSVKNAGPTYEEQKNGCYWDLLRAYVPSQSELVNASPLPMPEGALYRTIGYNDIEDSFRTYAEADKTVFSGFFKLGVGDSRNIAFLYDLPPNVVRRDGDSLVYDLLVQKQPGSISIPLEISVAPPTGYRFLTSSVPPSAVEAESIRFSLTLDVDLSLRLILEPGTGPPRLVPGDQTRQRIESLGPNAKTAFASVVVTTTRAGSATVDRVQVSPINAAAVPGQRVLFTAVAADAAGQPLRGIRLQWQVSDPAVGAISSSGLFTAGSAFGLHPGAVQVSVVSDGVRISDSATVDILSGTDVDPRKLDLLVVYPPEIAVRPGQFAGLGALGWDERGRLAPNVSFRWSVVDSRAGSIDRFGFFTASVNPGRYPEAIRVVALQDNPEMQRERSAFVSVTISETVNRGALSRIAILPRAIIVVSGQRIDFIAAAFDEGGQTIRNVSYQWAMAEPAAGRMRRAGSFVAGAVLGSYPGAIEVVALQQTSGSPLSARAVIDVVVRPPDPRFPLSRALPVPPLATVSPEQRFVFRSAGIDLNGNRVPAQAVWDVVDPRAGSITSLGVFIAGEVPGTYANAVRVRLIQDEEGQTHTAEAFATLTIHGPLERVEIEPFRFELGAGRSIRLRAVGFDENGLELPPLATVWTIEDLRAGTIDSTGLFVAGDQAGQFDGAIKVTAAEAE